MPGSTTGPHLGLFELRPHLAAALATAKIAAIDLDVVHAHLVVHHSDFDVLIPSHSRIGKLSGGTRISMLLGTPG